MLPGLMRTLKVPSGKDWGSGGGLNNFLYIFDHGTAVFKFCSPLLQFVDSIRSTMPIIHADAHPP